MSAGNCLGDNCRDYSRGTYHQYSGKAPGGAEMAWHRHRQLCRNTSGAPHEKSPPTTAPRLHQRLRYGEGKALHQECWDALR
jgi:hypothetical protein